MKICKVGVTRSQLDKGGLLLYVNQGYILAGYLLFFSRIFLKEGHKLCVSLSFTGWVFILMFVFFEGVGREILHLCGVSYRNETLRMSVRIS